MLESESIAAGVRTADEVVKTAPIELLEACPISTGKFLVLFNGGVAEVEASLEAGRRALGGFRLDELFLPRVHEAVAPAVLRRGESDDFDEALGVVESRSVASILVGADAAAKTARIRLLEVAPGRGIGGKGFFTMTGSVSDVEAAAEAATRPIVQRGFHVHTEILSGPDPILARRVARGLLRPFGESA